MRLENKVMGDTELKALAPGAGEERKLSVWAEYKKPAVQLMRPYVPGEDKSKISIPVGVLPVLGDMVAKSSTDESDVWLIKKEFFDAHYEYWSSVEDGQE